VESAMTRKRLALAPNRPMEACSLAMSYWSSPGLRAERAQRPPSDTKFRGDPSSAGLPGNTRPKPWPHRQPRFP
jgi:hypothetical protein